MKKGNTIIYCTYFDKNFVLKGLALHESLIRYESNAKLWILAFDKYTEHLLNKMKLKGVTVVSMRDFEDKKLLAVKPTRHPVEYCWTCTPSWVLYVLKNSKAEYVTYLDGDLYFYSDASIGVREIDKKSLLVVEHRFSKGREEMVKVSGKYNVAFNVFKNDEIGIKSLKRWREQCLDWCSWEPKNGRFGDQMYLDEWPKLYDGNLLVSKNIGLDVAPWNISQYKVVKRDNSVFVNKERLICYHFHTFKILGPNHFNRVMGYTLSKDVINHVYKPYEAELDKQYKTVLKVDKNFKIEKIEKNEHEALKIELAKHIDPVLRILRDLVKWPKN